MPKSVDKHEQFVQEIRKPLTKFEKKTDVTNPAPMDWGDLYDLQFELDHRFSELFGTPKKLKP